jgi:hypothetical protein
MSGKNPINIKFYVAFFVQEELSLKPLSLLCEWIVITRSEVPNIFRNSLSELCETINRVESQDETWNTEERRKCDSS